MPRSCSTKHRHTRWSRRPHQRSIERREGEPATLGELKVRGVIDREVKPPREVENDRLAGLIVHSEWKDRERGKECRSPVRRQAAATLADDQNVSEFEPEQGRYHGLRLGDGLDDRDGIITVLIGECKGNDRRDVGNESH